MFQHVSTANISFIQVGMVMMGYGRWETKDFIKEILGGQSELFFFPVFSGSLEVGPNGFKW